MFAETIKQGKKNGPFVETDKDGKVIKKGTYKFGRLQQMIGDR